MAKQRSMYGKDDLYVTDRSSPNATRVTDVQKWRTNQDDIRHLPGALPMQKLAIQDGAISPSAAFVIVDTEGGAPADDLTAINPGDLHDGMELELISADSSRVVTIKNSTAFSGIRTIRGEDIVLGMYYVFRLKLVSTESVTYWQELPAAVKISDSVSLEDSKTAASAKAVKTAYDRGTAGVTAANGKLSLSGGVMSGRIGGLRGNYNADASSRYATGALEIRENGGVGNAQSDIAYAPTIGFHWANKVAGLLALRSDGIFTFLKQNGTRAVVDCDVPYATAANKLRREGGVDTSWWWSGQGGQPGWLWGGNDGVNMYVYNPANFSVNYANSCNYANGAEYANNAGSVVGTPNINVNNNGFNTLPPGGTWRLIQSDGSGFLQIKGEYAGGTYVGYSKFMYIRIA